MKYENNNYNLKDIYYTIVDICNAIASVIDVDITVVDKALNRISGTGKYGMNIGEQLSKNCVFAYALERGERFIIENPREHEACYKCEAKEQCKEWAQVCCPIIVGNSIEGIIGLVAFNKAQKDKILQNKKNLLEFLSRMSDLIAVKLMENKKNRKVMLMAEELEILVNSIDVGVITTDEHGLVQRYNSIAEKIFDVKNTIKYITEIGGLKYYMQEFFHKQEITRINNKEFEHRVNGSKKASHRGLFSAKPIIINDEVTGFIFTFTNMNQIIKVVNDVYSSNMQISFDDIIGISKEIKMVKQYSEKISAGSSTVLIQGECGSGKELFARAIHTSSSRCANPFVAINCTAIPENLIESELFGYEEGAFTGAKKGGKLGKFELANKGTIFLDEIGDMPLNLQAKLLRVLQEGKIERVGGNSLIPINVRIVSATNKNLEEKVKEKEFREDLYYRLNVIPVFLPPLRKRLDDIEVLAKAFLKKYNIKLYRDIKGIDSVVISIFKNYKWPGNVRELENSMEYAVNMCGGEIITEGDLPRRLKAYMDIGLDSNKNSVTPLVILEKSEIEKAIGVYGSNSQGLEKACEALGISRATIYRKIKQYKIKTVSI